MNPVASWAEDATSVDGVMHALDSLRRTAEVGATRTQVMTLVLIGADPAEISRARLGLQHLGARHPARTIAIRVRREDESGLSATVELDGGADDVGRWVVSEHVGLDVGGAATRHLDSFIEPFTLPDLPVVVWFVDQLPSPADAVLASADVVVVDSRDFGGLECFSTVSAVAEHRPVIDLSWVRLQPWRAALRGLFDSPALLPFAHHVTAATVEGKTGPRHLVAAWLADRLDLALGDVRLIEADHVSLSLTAQAEGRHAVATVRRLDDRRALRVESSIEGGARVTSVQPLPPSGPAWGLAEGLSRLGRDPVFEAALAVALDF